MRHRRSCRRHVAAPEGELVSVFGFLSPDGSRECIACGATTTNPFAHTCPMETTA